jgi:ubiquinone/menaquinone biosynthesis C-methylase UbiE
MPTRYTHGHDDSVLASHRWRTAANSAGYLLPYLAGDQRILDVGCGPGTITLDLARIAADGQVVGIDTAEAVVVAAAAAAEEAGVANVGFACGDVTALEYDGESFDVVHAHQVLQHLEDPVAALREMRRVCRGDGVVAARDADYAAMFWAPADPRLERWRQLYRKVAVDNGGQPDAARQLLTWAHAAGFTDVVASAAVWCFATPEDRTWWGSTWARRISDSELADQLVERGLAERSELEDLATAWRAWAGDPDGWFCVVHGQVVCRP